MHTLEWNHQSSQYFDLFGAFSQNDMNPTVRTHVYFSNHFQLIRIHQTRTNKNGQVYCQFSVYYIWMLTLIVTLRI